MAKAKSENDFSFLFVVGAYNGSAERSFATCCGLSSGQHCGCVLWCRWIVLSLLFALGLC